MSLYAEYLMSRTTDRIIEMPGGFVTYRYLNEGKSVYLIDIYVVPKERQTGVGSMLADLVIKEAKENGCTEMLGTVDPKAKGSTTSMKALLGYGLELMQCEGNAIILRKDI